MGTRKRFTLAEDQQMIALADAGEHYAEIAKRISRNKFSIFTRLQMLRAHQQQGTSPKYPRGTKQPIVPADALLGLVRCLGGCNRQFNSPDRLRIRICPACKRKEDYINGPFTAEHALLI